MEPKFNADLLTRLVLWAATDQFKRDRPETALSMNLMTPKEAERLGRWGQASWGVARRNGVCNTAFCIAGGAVALDESLVMIMEYDGDGDWSAERVMPKSAVPVDVEVKWGMAWPSDHSEYENLAWDSGKSVSVRTAAIEILGITDSEASLLFNGDNSIQDVVEYALDIANDHNATLDFPAWLMEAYAPVTV